MSFPKFILLVAIIVFNNIVIAQTKKTTYAEKLGYPKGAKVLILHVDDAGMSYDSNKGVIEAITNGAANSTSVMMPCAWVPGFVHFLKLHPEVDAGLHLTLTSEWKDYRWAPVAGRSAVRMCPPRVPRSTGCRSASASGLRSAGSAGYVACGCGIRRRPRRS